MSDAVVASGVDVGNTLPRQIVRQFISADQTTECVVLHGQREAGKTWLLKHVSRVGRCCCNNMSEYEQEISKAHSDGIVPGIAFIDLSQVRSKSGLAAAIDRAFAYEGPRDVVDGIRTVFGISPPAHPTRSADEQLARALEHANDVAHRHFNQTGKALPIVFDDLDALCGSVSAKRLSMQTAEELIDTLVVWTRQKHISPIVACSDQHRAQLLFGTKNLALRMVEIPPFMMDEVTEYLRLNLADVCREKGIDQNDLITQEVAMDVAGLVGTRAGSLRQLLRTALMAWQADGDAVDTNTMAKQLVAEARKMHDDCYASHKATIQLCVQDVQEAFAKDHLTMSHADQARALAAGLEAVVDGLPGGKDFEKAQQACVTLRKHGARARCYQMLVEALLTAGVLSGRPTAGAYVALPGSKKALKEASVSTSAEVGPQPKASDAQPYMETFGSPDMVYRMTTQMQIAAMQIDDNKEARKMQMQIAAMQIEDHKETRKMQMQMFGFAALTAGATAIAAILSRK